MFKTITQTSHVVGMDAVHSSNQDDMWEWVFDQDAYLPDGDGKVLIPKDLLLGDSDTHRPDWLEDIHLRIPNDMFRDLTDTEHNLYLYVWQ